MKYIINMTLEERADFHIAVENYLRDNVSYIKELAGPENLVEASLNHYKLSVESSGKEDERLSKEQEETFLAVAKLYFT